MATIVEELAGMFPELYHIAEDGAWDYIQSHGLLPTETLLRLFQAGKEIEQAVASHPRRASIELNHKT